LEIGGGTFVLTANNAYLGATTIDPGATLALAGTGSIASSSGVTANGRFDISGTSTGAPIGALTGTGLVSLGGQTLTVNNASGSFSGVLADGGLSGGVGGGLTIAGGSQTLTGSNTYTGATTINAGTTLALTGSGSIAQSSGVTANGTFDISGTNSGASILSLSGSGAVNLGSQLLTLTNASGAFSGTIGGNGGLSIGGGFQALTGNNTYTGGTTVSGGATLAVGSDNALGAAGSTLTLNGGGLLALSSFSTVRATIIGAAGGLLNANGFQMALNGPMSINGPLVTFGSLFGGATTVSSGQTSINGGFTAPSLVIASGAVLRGIGTINAPTQIMGRLAPGNSPGTLTFSAPVTLGSSSISQFDIDGTGIGTGAGNYSRIIVTGSGNSLTAAGTLLPLLRGITGNAANSYTPPIGQGFNVVSTAGGVQGSYASLTQPTGLASGTRFDALYDPTTLNLVVTPAYYGNLALAWLSETANQAAVGSALDAARPTAGVAMSTAQVAVYAPLYVLPGSLITPTLEQVAPTIYGDAMMVGRNNWYMVAAAINEQLEARRGALVSDKAQVTAGPNGSTIWLSGLGQFDNVNSNGTAGYSSSAGGVATGIDIPITPQLQAGAAFGFSNQVTSAKNSASFNGDAFQFELYGSLRQGIGFLDTQAGGLFSEGTATRPLAAYGVQANGNTSGSAAGGSMRAGVRLDSGEWHVEPSLMLDGVALHQGSLTETQAGSAGLSVSSASLGSLQTLLGVRVERRIALTETVTLVPSAQVGWLHEYLDTQAATQASFIGAPGAGFSVQSAPVGRDAAALGLRASLDMNGPISVYASYAGTLNGSSNAQTVSAGLRYVW
jgi:outer membrane autotransporter protein